MSFSARAVLAVPAGALAALGHAPFGLWWVSLPAFACLLALVAFGKRPVLAAWLGGAGYFGVALHWIVEPFLVDIATHGWMAPGALILLSGGLALLWALSAFMATLLSSPGRDRAFSFAIVLTAAEVLRGHLFTGFPWALPAYIWADTPVIGVVSVTGSYGLVGLTLLATALPAMMRMPTVGIVLGCTAIVVLFLVGGSQLDPARNEARSLGFVRLVQPNVPQEEKWQRDKVPEHLDRLLSLTSQASVEPVDMVVWPEAAVVYPLDQATQILADAAAVAPGNAEVVLGINRRNAAEDWFNALIVVGEDGTLKETYDKVHLVPFGEYIPFRLNFLRAMAASSGFGFTPGDGVRLIETPLGRALPLICYEGIFPRHLFKARERPDYILLITNDAWFGTFSGPYQHLDQARFRAVEHGLPVIRAANTGVSTVISRFGELESVIGLGDTGFSDQLVETGSQETLYSRTGDWPTMLLLAIVLLGLLLRQMRNAIANGRSSV